VVIIPQIEDLLLNEYNRALDLRNLNKSRIMTFRGLSIGTSFTLIATIFTAPVFAIGIYIFVVMFISGLIISLFFTEYGLVSKLERIENYCNYIQIIIKKFKEKEIEEFEKRLDNPKTMEESTTYTNKNPFIPLSYIFNYLRKEEINLAKVKESYKNAELSTILKKEPIKLKDWIMESFNVIRFIILIIIAITIAFISIMGITTGSEVGISWFDAYSLVHVGIGVSIFFFLSLLHTIPKFQSKKEWLSMLSVFILTIFLLIGWEIIENTLVLALGIKASGKIDSPQNLTSDLIFGILGAGFLLIVFNIFYEEKKMEWVYYVIGGVSSSLYFIYLLIFALFF
jgi:hypothetical protein